MNHLFRELAPISDRAWSEIEDEAVRTLRLYLAGRKVVDFNGPLGYDTPSISLDRLDVLDEGPAEGVTAMRRAVLPLIELHRDFTLDRNELDSFDRGGDGDLDPLVEACRSLASAEDALVFEGFSAGDVEGIAAVSPHDPITLSTDYDQYPSFVASAVSTLKDAGVDGPFALAIGPRCYAGIMATEKGGVPIMEHLDLILDGPVIWAPAVDGAVVVSQRGGDFELTLGQDTSIGYRSHDADSVTLQLQETVAFVATSPEAGIAMRYPEETSKRRGRRS